MPLLLLLLLLLYNRLGLSDHFLVGRTGFSVNRFDYGVSERIGSRPSMEDKSTIIQVPV
jgi:hypothetical protein